MIYGFGIIIVICVHYFELLDPQLFITKEVIRVCLEFYGVVRCIMYAPLRAESDAYIIDDEVDRIYTIFLVVIKDLIEVTQHGKFLSDILTFKRSP